MNVAEAEELANKSILFGRQMSSGRTISTTLPPNTTDARPHLNDMASVYLGDLTTVIVDDRQELGGIFGRPGSLGYSRHNDRIDTKLLKP